MTNKGLDDDNFYRYTIETRQWKIMQVSGVKPGLRVHHSMNIFKPDSLIIFGGKVKSGPGPGDIVNSNDLVYLDLKEMDISTPFLANIGPSQRFGHASAYNTNFQPDAEYVIVGGLDETFCPIDVYVVCELEITNNKKWVYEQKKMHSNQNADYKDDIYETAKKTIINYKKQLEQLTSQNIEVNKKYSEYFNTLNLYKKNLLEEDLTYNEKKTQQRRKKMEIEGEKREYSNQIKELKEYNNLLNMQLKIIRERFLILSEFLEDSMDDVKFMDEILCTVDKSPNKLLLFSNIDLDSLSYKRRNYKLDMDSFRNFFKNSSIFEKELYEKILYMVKLILKYY